MATNYTQASDLLGCNLEGNEQPSTGTDGVIQIPRVPLLTPVLISGGRMALYVIGKPILNPASTVSFKNASAGNSLSNVYGTVTATTGHASASTAHLNISYFVTLNTATTSSGDCIWARTSVTLTY